MQATLHIRRATAKDIEPLIALLQQLFSIEADFTFDSSKQRQGLTMLLEDTQRSCLLVAELKQEILGMCSAQLLISTAEGGHKALLEDLVVAEEHRGKQIGYQLLRTMESWAFRQGAKRLDLLADCNNTPALAFYKKRKWSSTDLICLQKRS